MTEISPEERDLIDRYLANRLTGMEAQLVDTRIVEDPVFRNEVELSAAFRDGLRELHLRGELTPLLSSRQTMWRHPRFAMAASAAAVALGLTSFLLLQRFESPPAAAVDELLVFERTRGPADGADLAWQVPAAPGVVEMRFDVGLDPAPAYEAVIVRDARELMRATAATGSDGLAVLRADAALFEPGDYAIRLTAPGSSEALTFTLRVTPRR